MKTAVIIPARYGSTRLPGKVLLKKNGKYIMQHTYEQVLKCKLVDRIIIATDDKRILKAGMSFGAEVIITSREHTCGTERIAEIARHLPHRYIINVQADEPRIDPVAIERVIKTLHNNPDVDIATLSSPLSKKDIPDPNKVKVILDRNKYATGFYRLIKGIKKTDRLYRHIGIYGYKKDALMRLVKLPQTESEKNLRLEQIRALENGFRIKVVLIKKAFHGIDTADDYRDFLQYRKV
ncbi:MAG: 3-deoxy-manno-octulosonate cytidylyltransferase [Planctomycetota bacterium]|nr:3-deoxy-manno-octulosonate cytidylyltransferase [Planctomycetota bacterium]MDI6788344.1 3-deoxy-manno-octulosonate cytidylyltransferase [Planctomycetota bacterium]